MKGPGLFWMLQVALGLSIAGPMFIIGFDFTRTGQPVFGIFFFGAGLIALFAPNYLIRRIGGPRTWIRRRLRRRADDSEPSGGSMATDNDTGESKPPSSAGASANASDSNSTNANASESSPSLVERIRRRGG